MQNMRMSECKGASLSILESEIIAIFGFRVKLLIFEVFAFQIGATLGCHATLSFSSTEHLYTRTSAECKLRERAQSIGTSFHYLISYSNHGYTRTATVLQLFVMLSKRFDIAATLRR